MNLNEGKWIRDFPEFIESENEGKIYAKPPETYGKVPELREVEGLVKFTFEEIENYFREARQAELRLGH